MPPHDRRRTFDMRLWSGARSLDNASTLLGVRKKLDRRDELTAFIAIAVHRSRPATTMRVSSDYVEKLEPQPQDLVEWGLMKLNAWRIRVSS